MYAEECQSRTSVPDLLRRAHFLQITYGVHVEDDDGQVVFLAHASSRKVHDFQAAFQYFVVSDVVEFRCRRVFLRSAV